MMEDLASGTSPWRRRLRSALTYVPLRLPAIWRSHRTSTFPFNGFVLTISPGVFHPLLYRSSTILARAIEGMALKGKRVLDMGTGSGIIALHAARAGAEVVAVDIDKEAAASAYKNVLANGYPDRVRVLWGDLFDPVGTDQFDIIVWNPPFYPGEPHGPAEFAWRAGPGYETLRRFGGEVPCHLRDDGACLLILSSDSDIPRICTFFEKDLEPPRLVHRQRAFLEEFFVIVFARRTRPST